MPQTETPLYTALKDHIAKKPTSFHVPGHKYGDVFPSSAKSDYEEILKLDATELSGLDDLHDPTGAIYESQHLLAELYQVQKSFFLVNGTTVGNLAMIHSVCNEADIVLVQRNCHKSIINGLMLAGASPVFLHPVVDENVGVPAYVPFETIKEAIKTHPHAKALILTNPNYYGMAIDLTKVVEFAHQYNIPVLVDEAHGVHFIAGAPFPKAAVTAGADIIVNSAHKTLPAMTMGSYLHLNSKLIDESSLAYYLHALQSSSPSYPIMASLDLARFYLANFTKDEIRTLKEEIDLFKDGLRSINQIEVVETSDSKITTDILKVTIQTRCSLSGFQLQTLLEEQQIFTELADHLNVLFVLPLACHQDYHQTVSKMKAILKSYKRIEQPIMIKHSLVKSGFQALPICYKGVKRYNREVVHLQDSIGRLAAQMVIPYPPGIPLLMVGELITDEHIKQMYELLRFGAKIQGYPLIEQNKIEVFTI